MGALALLEFAITTVFGAPRPAAILDHSTFHLSELRHHPTYTTNELLFTIDPRTSHAPPGGAPGRLAECVEVMENLQNYATGYFPPAGISIQATEALAQRADEFRFDRTLVLAASVGSRQLPVALS